jgi:prepilin-type N-terminal cleavage/methylation domain-containing protein
MPRNKKQKKIRQSGFTLLELIISISVMAVLTSVLLVNFGTVSKNGHFNTSLDTLISNLHKQQSLSISSRDVAGTPSSAYGIEFQAGSLSSSYNLFTEDKAGLRKSSNVVEFPKGIYIDSIIVIAPDPVTGGIFINPSTVTTRFLVPYGRTTATYSGANNQQDAIVMLNLGTFDGSKYKQIVINGITGNISTQ